MKTGWCIYLHTQLDRSCLIERGLTLAGQYALRSSFKPSVKITLKDLPLDMVDNEEVLETVKTVASVLSPVNYSNVWFNGKMTNICNGDMFVYIEAKDVAQFPNKLQVGEHVAWVFKPPDKEVCK